MPSAIEEPPPVIPLYADDLSKMGANGAGFGLARLMGLIALALTVAGLPRPLSCLAQRELTTVRDIRALTPDQASQARPVRLRGVVTVLSGWKSSFFFQDATQGISVDRASELLQAKPGSGPEAGTGTGMGTGMEAEPQVEPGQSVEIRGVTGPGLFAPIVVARSVTVLGRGKLPPASLFGFDKLAGGKKDSQWLAIRGIVRSAAVKPSWGRSVLLLEIDIGAGNLVTARVHDFPKTGWERLPASTVLVRGVCGTVFNDKRQFVGLRLFVAHLNDVKIERPAPLDPFDLPLRPLDSLLQFGDQAGAIQRIRVRGTVTYSQPGHGLYIQDGAQGVFVQSGQSAAVALGSQLEAVGYPAAGRYSPKLDDAVIRVLGAGQPPAGLRQSASAMIVDRDGFPSAPYDSILVQLKGRLVEEIPGPDQDQLLFKDGASIFTARLPRTGQIRRALTAGSLASVTGICAANADEAHEARSFELLLRSPADLVVLEDAPWWTASRAGWIVALLVLVILAMGVWIAVVRKQSSLRLLTVTDPLTGLLNRRGFVLLAEQQWRLAQRSKIHLILFYIDLDRFKEINDSLGHKEGDLALQAVAALLRQCFRKTDILGRLGGDEFAVFAIDARPDSQETLELRLAKSLELTNEKAAKPYQLSLSTGVLACGTELGTLAIEDLLARADALMYECKRTRRNCRA